MYQYNHNVIGAAYDQALKKKSLNWSKRFPNWKES